MLVNQSKYFTSNHTESLSLYWGTNNLFLINLNLILVSRQARLPVLKKKCVLILSPRPPRPGLNGKGV